MNLMSLSSESNTINALGIFGRLTPDLEKFFDDLEAKYSQRPANDDANGVFRHLTLVINRDVVVGQIPKYIDLLRNLKRFLPVRIKTSGVIVREDKHIALTFDVQQTQEIRDIVNVAIGEGGITTFYTKVVWFVPETNRDLVSKELAKIDEMVFSDFYLVANRQNEENTIYTSQRYRIAPEEEI